MNAQLTPSSTGREIDSIVTQNKTQQTDVTRLLGAFELATRDNFDENHNPMNIMYALITDLHLSAPQLSTLSSRLSEYTFSREKYRQSKRTLVDTLLRNSLPFIKEETISLTLDNYDLQTYFFQSMKLPDQDITFQIYGNTGDKMLTDAGHFTLHLHGSTGHRCLSAAEHMKVTILDTVGDNALNGARNCVLHVNGNVAEYCGYSSKNCHINIKGNADKYFLYDAVGSEATVHGNVGDYALNSAKGVKVELFGDIGTHAFQGTKDSEITLHGSCIGIKCLGPNTQNTVFRCRSPHVYSVMSYAAANMMADYPNNNVEVVKI